MLFALYTDLLTYSLEQNDESCSHGTPACHHLAVTYCLRALCTQEVEPNSKVLITKG